MSSEDAPALLENPTKPTVIGIYGVSGCGKSTLLQHLQKELGTADFLFYDGSTAIQCAFPGNIAAFKLLNIDQQTYWRQAATSNIQEICKREGKTGIVAGHYMFWNDEYKLRPDIVWTDSDESSYTHIFYLEQPAEIIRNRRTADTIRARSPCSVAHIRNWQKTEKKLLRHACLRAGIVFTVLPFSQGTTPEKYTERLVRRFQYQSMTDDASRAQTKLDQMFRSQFEKLQTMIVLDGDKTLIAEDTGKLFWKSSNCDPFQDGGDPLKAVFSSREKYEDWMFHQAKHMYREVGDIEYADLCDIVVSSTKIRPDFNRLLTSAALHEHVGVVIVTAGIGQIFAKLLEREGLSESVAVIGSDRDIDGLVVTPHVKESLVRYMRRSYGTFVFAFGDSPVDIGMLGQADESILVIAGDKNQNENMRSALESKMKAYWPSTSRLKRMLPSDTFDIIDDLDCFQMDSSFLEKILARASSCPASPLLFDATSQDAAKLLMTPMRNAKCHGPNLRKAHLEVGKYLATQFATQAVGVETFPILHVQGQLVDGYRLRDEQKTLIVALMRGGEPMALGVSEAFPSAIFLHARNPDDINEETVRRTKVIMLVDSVINSGKSMLEFIRHVRSFHAKILVIVITGVVQSQAVAKGEFAAMLKSDRYIRLICLRQSANKFTGKGGTDTGNRLFNTISL